MMIERDTEILSVAAWERPVLLRMDAADAENARGVGADRDALAAAVTPRRS